MSLRSACLNSYKRNLYFTYSYLIVAVAFWPNYTAVACLTSSQAPIPQPQNAPSVSILSSYYPLQSPAPMYVGQYNLPSLGTASPLHVLALD